MEDFNNVWIGLFKKARRFAHFAHGSSDQRFLFFAFSIEYLFRACLAKKHPLILLSGREDQFRNGLIELYTGIPGEKEAFTIGDKEVGLRFAKLFKSLWDDKDVFDAFDAYRIGRNEDVHTGKNPWDKQTPLKWTEQFYLLAQKGTMALGVTLEDFLGAAAAATASEYLEARTNRIDNQYNKLLGQAKARFELLSSSGERLAERQSVASAIVRNATANNRSATVAKCPACESDAIVANEAVTASSPVLMAGEFIQNVTARPGALMCSVCDLNLIGNVMLQHAGLGDLVNIEVPVDIRTLIDLREHVDPVDLLSPSDQQALRDGRALHDHWEDEEMQRWKDGEQLQRWKDEHD